jgi:hypothetical protein
MQAKVIVAGSPVKGGVLFWAQAASSVAITSKFKYSLLIIDPLFFLAEINLLTGAISQAHPLP